MELDIRDPANQELKREKKRVSQTVPVHLYAALFSGSNKPLQLNKCLFKRRQVILVLNEASDGVCVR